MTEQLAQKVLTGNRRAVARLITRIENNHPHAKTDLATLYPHTGKSHLVGVTGSPGTGKSSLVNKLAKACRQKDKTIAILAIDPTSPFSGGAILGDRIRMNELVGDKGAYIRSMASRGSLGGLAAATDDAIKVLDAAGFDVIFIETVGAGQSEVEIVKTAHTVIVVEAPGLGDDVQAIKAGILEIADIFVVNKADRNSAGRAVASLKMMLELGHPTSRVIMHHGQMMQVGSDHPHKVQPCDSADEQVSTWLIPVLKTVALTGKGIDEVMTAIDQHYQHLQHSGELAERNRNRLRDEVRSTLQLKLMRRFLAKIPSDDISAIMSEVINRRLSPYNAVQQILDKGF